MADGPILRSMSPAASAAMGGHPMGKVITAFLVIAGIWVGVELFTYGPSRAFGGMLSPLFGEGSASSVEREPTTAQRAGQSVARARDEASERRERMLAE
jgi:hypothetical protein